MNRYRKKYTRYKKVKLKFHKIRLNIVGRRANDWLKAEIETFIATKKRSKLGDLKERDEPYKRPREIEVFFCKHGIK